MKFSDKALGMIGRELLGNADRNCSQGAPPPSRQKPTTPARGTRRGAYNSGRKATVLSFRKRHR